MKFFDKKWFNEFWDWTPIPIWVRVPVLSSETCVVWSKTQPSSSRILFLVLQTKFGMDEAKQQPQGALSLPPSSVFLFLEVSKKDLFSIVISLFSKNLNKNLIKSNQWSFLLDSSYISCLLLQISSSIHLFWGQFWNFFFLLTAFEGSWTETNWWS